jgi:hypothetical protein
MAQVAQCPLRVFETDECLSTVLALLQPAGVSCEACDDRYSVLYRDQSDATRESVCVWGGGGGGGGGGGAAAGGGAARAGGGGGGGGGPKCPRGPPPPPLLFVSQRRRVAKSSDWCNAGRCNTPHGGSGYMCAAFRCAVKTSNTTQADTLWAEEEAEGEGEGREGSGHLQQRWLPSFQTSSCQISSYPTSSCPWWWRVFISRCVGQR